MNDLLRPEVLQAFDRATFERDGYWVWESILTDAARKRWTANLAIAPRSANSAFA